MTKAQMKVQINQDAADASYERRKFRKKCVALGIVKFVRGYVHYELEYRGCFVCTLFKDLEGPLKLLAVWNTIRIAEETIEKIEGEKYESK